MASYFLTQLAGIIVLGIGGQWLAWRLQFPSILMLLILGIAAGPASGSIDPDRLMGEMLTPFISISLAIILFEGGLSLKIADLVQSRKVVLRLLTWGVLITWTVSALAAWILLDMGPEMAILLGAILVVTGPTVILPLLLHVRPQGRASPILKWEGIMNDPIGAILSVLIFQAILAASLSEAAMMIELSIAKAIIIGGGIGILAAEVLVEMLRRFWIPDFLQEVFSLMVVVAAFSASDWFQPESGLLAATIMGISLANQNRVNVREIVEFKENLRIILISLLFIILVARSPRSYVEYINPGSLAFLAVLMLIARPLAAWLCTMGSGLSWKERLFISWMAPRGIVAAAISSIFAIELSEQGVAQAEALAPYTFIVVAGTVAAYGLSAPTLARHLGLSKPNSQGVVIAGAHPWAREMAFALQKEGFNVLLVDTNQMEIQEAFRSGLPTYHGSILSESIFEEVELGGFGHLLALTPNDKANSLAALHFAEAFGRAEVYQLPPEMEAYRGKEAFSPKHLRGRLLFNPQATYSGLSSQFRAGAKLMTVAFTESFKFHPSKGLFHKSNVPLFHITPEGNLQPFTSDFQPIPLPKSKIISLVIGRESTQNHGENG